MNGAEKIKKLKGPIFIFGAGGFIGSNLLYKISSQRDDVYGIIRNKTNSWRLNALNINREKILIADVLSKEELRLIFDRYSPKTIFNLSAYGSSSYQRDYNLIYNVNLVGTANIVDTSNKESIFINAGSSSEYGYNSSHSSESNLLQPNSHYSVSKIASSYLTSFYAKTHNRLALNLRLFSIYGQFEDTDRLIPKLIEKARDNKLPKLVSKNISRDFVFIDDCIDAFIQSALSLSTNSKISGNSYNICSGKMTTIEDLVNKATDLFSIEEKPNWGSMKNRSWDQLSWYGDPTNTSNDIGWTYSTSITEGLKKCYKWQEKVSYDDLILSSSKETKKLSAVIACYKDGEAIPVMYDRLKSVFKKIKTDYEIIFVNDCSPDNSEDIIKEICKNDSRVVGISHSRNFGSQAAFMSGMELSTGDGVILLDGDLQDPPEVIEKFFNEWIKGYEVVYGVRVKREMSIHFNFVYKLFYIIFQKLSYINIPKNAGDFSLIDRVVVNKLIELPETEQFLRGLRAWVGFNQIGVDYIRPKRMFGDTTNNLFKNIWWARKAIFSFSFQPLSFMSYLGILFTFIAFTGVIVQLVLRFVLSDIPSGFTTVIILVLFFGGINLLAISFIGEYVSKIFEETKKRPKFIRRKIIIGSQEYKTKSDIEDLNKVKSKNILIKD